MHKRLSEQAGDPSLCDIQGNRAAAQTLTPGNEPMISRCLVFLRKCSDKRQHPCLKLIKAMQGDVETLAHNWPALFPVHLWLPFRVVTCMCGRPQAARHPAVTTPQVTCQLDSYWDTSQNEKETLPSQYGASNHSSHCTKDADQW